MRNQLANGYLVARIATGVPLIGRAKIARECRVGSTIDWLRATGRWPRLRGAIGRRNSG